MLVGWIEGKPKAIEVIEQLPMPVIVLLLLWLLLLLLIGWRNSLPAQLKRLHQRATTTAAAAIGERGRESVCLLLNQMPYANAI